MYRLLSTSYISHKTMYQMQNIPNAAIAPKIG
jgi:hypothetical protein